jgi:hypothetical protein
MAADEMYVPHVAFKAKTTPRPGDCKIRELDDH